MLNRNQREKLYLERFLILVVSLSLCCSCVSLRPPPKVTKCLTDFNRGGMDCINSSGTEFFIKWSDKDVHDHVCMPGKQFIDATAWLQELIVIMTKDKK